MTLSIIATSARLKWPLGASDSLIDLLFGLLVQLTPVFVQDMLWVMMGGQEAYIMDLGPAALLRAQEMRLASKKGLESLQSS
jgi:hypothetical protein